MYSKFISLARNFCILAAVALSACSTVSTDATKAEKSTDHAVARLDGFVRDNIKPSVDKADNWLSDNIGPYLHSASQAFFCNRFTVQGRTGKCGS